ncbi:MAG: molybdenum cofactor guanylyltransferase [Deltaproteobacteria bacterium]|nr:molybdenum cofactor guanylyltransferase [Deltaproteobacteria bacterium]
MAGTAARTSITGVDITGAVLAGGLSRRLGRDKATLVLAGKPLALWVAELLAPWVGDLWLVTNTPIRHMTLGLPMVSDLVANQGPLGGVRTALFYSRTPWVLAVSVDNPFLSDEVLAALCGRAAATGRPAVVCRSEQGLQPFPGLYHVRLLERLGAYLQGNLRVRPFLEKIRPDILPPEVAAGAEARSRCFFNLNTKEDWLTAEAWMTQRREISGE